MAINVEGYRVLGQLADRQQLHAHAQQERWLYQMEQAMLQQEGKKPAPAREQSRAGQERSRDAQPSNEQGNAASYGLTALGTQTVSPQAAHADTTGPQAESPDSASPAQHAADAHSAASGGEAAPSEAAARTADSASAGVAAGVLAIARLPANGHAAMPALARAATGVGQSVAATLQQDPAALTAANVRVAANAPANLPVPGMAPAPAPASAPQASDEMEQYSARRPAVPAQATAEEDYASRLLHIYHDPDGVQAWIRDAAIDQAHARTLALAMADELAANGTTLVALTLNGRKLTLPAATPADDTDKFLNPDRGAETQQRSTVPQDLTTHGAT